MSGSGSGRPSFLKPWRMDPSRPSPTLLSLITASDTRAYGNPGDLAQDANLDLVVCSTRVDRHYITIKPSILAGKAVFVEWPLASNTSQARGLASLARRQSISCVAGLQGPATAPISEARKLLEDGLLGKVLSSEVKACGGAGSHDTIPESLRYFTQMAVGGMRLPLVLATVSFPYSPVPQTWAHSPYSNGYKCGSSYKVHLGKFMISEAGYSCSGPWSDLLLRRAS